MLKVSGFMGSKIVAEFAGVDLWRLSLPVYVEVATSEGKLLYYMKPGFPTDMRSGSHLIDRIIPKFSNNNEYNLALLCHDFAYTKNIRGENFLSRAIADELLRQMCIISGEIGKFRAAVMYGALRIGGKSAYECENKGKYENAGEYINFFWMAK